MLIIEVDVTEKDRREKGKTMKSLHLFHDRKKFLIAAGITLVAMVVLLAGCGGMALQKWAMFKSNDDVKKGFESYTLNPAYTYYYSGPDAHPIAILGVKKDLILEPADLWKPIKSPEQLKEAVVGMEYYLRGLNHYAWGFDIIDRQNNKIGIWYSIPLATTTTLEKGNGVVAIYTPDIETYMRLERDGALPH
jgi:hypothetical protein